MYLSPHAIKLLRDFGGTKGPNKEDVGDDAAVATAAAASTNNHHHQPTTTHDYSITTPSDDLTKCKLEHLSSCRQRDATPPCSCRQDKHNYVDFRDTPKTSVVGGLTSSDEEESLECRGCLRRRLRRRRRFLEEEEEEEKKEDNKLKMAEKNVVGGGELKGWIKGINWLTLTYVSEGLEQKYLLFLFEECNFGLASFLLIAVSTLKYIIYTFSFSTLLSRMAIIMTVLSTTLVILAQTTMRTSLNVERMIVHSAFLCPLLTLSSISHTTTTTTNSLAVSPSICALLMECLTWSVIINVLTPVRFAWCVSVNSLLFIIYGTTIFVDPWSRDKTILRMGLIILLCVFSFHCLREVWSRRRFWNDDTNNTTTIMTKTLKSKAPPMFLVQEILMLLDDSDKLASQALNCRDKNTRGLLKLHRNLQKMQSILTSTGDLYSLGNQWKEGTAGQVYMDLFSGIDTRTLGSRAPSSGTSWKSFKRLRRSAEDFDKSASNCCSTSTEEQDVDVDDSAAAVTPLLDDDVFRHSDDDDDEEEEDVVNKLKLAPLLRWNSTLASRHDPRYPAPTAPAASSVSGLSAASSRSPPLVRFDIPNFILSDLTSKVGVEWNFNCLELSEKSDNVLMEVGFALLHDHCCKGSLNSNLGVSRRVLLNFLCSIQALYQSTPYHNPLHGAAVAHSMAVLGRQLQLLNPKDPRNWVTLIVAALCHDVGHPGRNNMFFINSYDQLALIYNDQAVLENFHAYTTFKALDHDSCDLFSNLTESEFRTSRQHIIELILATDMRQHFENVTRLKVRAASSDFNPRSPEDLTLIAKTCMKMADLSHAAVEWQQHFEWSCRITEEFYEQGDEEFERGLALSPLCDRSKHFEFPKSQIGFLDFVVKPLALEVVYLDKGGGLSVLLAQLDTNLEKWAELAEKNTKLQQLTEWPASLQRFVREKHVCHANKPSLHPVFTGIMENKYLSSVRPSLSYRNEQTTTLLYTQPSKLLPTTQTDDEVEIPPDNNDSIKEIPPPPSPPPKLDNESNGGESSSLSFKPPKSKALPIKTRRKESFINSSSLVGYPLTSNDNNNNNNQGPADKIKLIKRRPKRLITARQVPISEASGSIQLTFEKAKIAGGLGKVNSLRRRKFPHGLKAEETS